MSATEAKQALPTGVELAAGGLVWSNRGGGLRLAVVHRPRHQDWTLPKGRPKAGEGLEATALREAMEETRHKAAPDRFAGSYWYLKAGVPKVVLMWHMTGRAEPYEHPAADTEVERVVWLLPTEALSLLSHPTERDFVARHCGEALRGPEGNLTGSRDPRSDRLRAALQSTREKLHGLLERRPGQWDSWWAACTRRSLAAAEAAVHRDDMDGGWGSLHDAQRFMVFGLEDSELVAHAATVRAKAREKLKGWRGEAAAALFRSLKVGGGLKPDASLPPAERLRLQHVLVESLGVLNQHSDDRYHRLHLVRKQLDFLVKVCAFLLLAALVTSAFATGPESKLHWPYLLAVGCAGALGGVVSAMFQLSRVGEAKISEALLYGLITTGRPLVGSACALFIYVAMQSNVISLIDASKVGLEAGLVLGFVAGFSEQFVLATVTKVAGTGRDETGSEGKPVERREPPANTPEGGGSAIEPGGEAGGSADQTARLLNGQTDPAATSTDPAKPREG